MTLFLSDVAGSEILLILVFILIFFGSKSIPGIAKTFGRTIRQIKDASQDLQEEIKKSGVDIKKDLNLEALISKAESTMDQVSSQIEEPVGKITNQITDTVSYHKSNFFANVEDSNSLPQAIGETNENRPTEDQDLDEESEKPPSLPTGKESNETDKSKKAT